MVNWLDKKKGTIVFVIIYLIVVITCTFVGFNPSRDYLFWIFFALIPFYYGILTYIKKKSILKVVKTIFNVTSILIIIYIFTQMVLQYILRGHMLSETIGLVWGIFGIIFLVLVFSVLTMIGLLFHKYYYKKRKN